MKTDGKSLFFSKEEIPEPTENERKFILRHELMHAMMDPNAKRHDIVKAMTERLAGGTTLH